MKNPLFFFDVKNTKISSVFLLKKEKYKTFDQYAHQTGRTTKVKQHTRVHQPYIRAKLFGGVLIAIGGALLSFTFFLSPNPLDPFHIKLAFTALLIGAFMMLLITEQPTCGQYPCSAWSAVLTAITQAAQEKIWVQETSRVGNKTIFHLKIGG